MFFFATFFSKASFNVKINQFLTCKNKNSTKQQNNYQKKQINVSEVFFTYYPTLKFISLSKQTNKQTNKLSPVWLVYHQTTQSPNTTVYIKELILTPANCFKVRIQNTGYQVLNYQLPIRGVVKKKITFLADMSTNH